MAREGVFTVEQVVDKMCHAPARLYRIDRRGFLRPGYHADIAIIDPRVEFTVTRQDVVSRCGWSPFVGTVFHNRVIKTFVNGAEAYSCGVFSKEPCGQRMRFN